MKASDLFVKSLENEGVEYIFGIPGEENLDMLDSLSRSSIKLILTRHEQAAGFMAATLGRLTGKVGVCMSTLGPGATNLVTAAAYAQLGGMPILMVTGQKPIKSSKQGQFQIIDVVDMMGPITKYTHQIASGDSIPTRVREAFRIAAEEKPGATHLELPEDIAAEETDRVPVDASLVRRPIAEPKSIARAVELLRSPSTRCSSSPPAQTASSPRNSFSPSSSARASPSSLPKWAKASSMSGTRSSSAMLHSPPETSSTARSRPPMLSSISATMSSKSLPSL